ncbi:MAG: PHP domain-containing protein [Planctomycetota bacterium]|jgi:hypothetical protein
MDKNLQLINSQDSSPEERLNAALQLSKSHLQDMKSVCEADLHIHSFYSDGYNSPAGRVFEAWRRNMKAIALTDHDNFDGCIEALDAGEIFRLDVIPGIEFYTDRTGIEIIGYWPDTDEFRRWLNLDGGKKIIEPIRQAKKQQLSSMVARVPSCMKRHGLDAEITQNDIKNFVRNGISTKGDISVIMWQKYGRELAAHNIATDVKDFQAKYTTQDNELNVKVEIDIDLAPAAFVKRINNWGGLAGISHPTELRNKEGLGNNELYKIISSLGGFGLQTLEVDGWRNTVDPETNKTHTELFFEMLKRYNSEFPDRPPLLCTNGSDDHNQPGEELEMGCGRENNLKPEFGKYEMVEKLRSRSIYLKNQRN